MKYLLSYISIIVLIVSCNKDDDNSRYWGFASAKLNGEIWNGEIWAAYNHYPSEIGINIFINSFNQKGLKNDLLDFTKIPLEIGKYYLSETSVLIQDSLSGSSYTTLLSHGDVIGDLFYLEKNDLLDDFLEITEISGDEIKGTFQVSFLRDTSILPSTASTPDTIIFTNGQFHTRIVD